MGAWLFPTGNSLPGLLWSVSIVVIGLGVVYLGHELGHVLAAKAFRLKLARYYFGFDTVANPLNFAARPVWQRMIIILAGPLMSLLMAVAFASVAYRFGVSYTPCIIGGTSPGEPAWELGLRPGDKILQIGRFGKPNEHLRFTKDLMPAIILNGSDKEMDILVRRRGQSNAEWIRVQPSTPVLGSGNLARLGVTPATTTKLNAALPANGYPFEHETDNLLQAGDEIVAVDGVDLPRDESSGEILSYHLEEMLFPRLASPVMLTVLRQREAQRGNEPSRSLEQVTLPPRRMRVLGLSMEARPIVGVRRGSSAATAGFHEGDLIVSVAGEDVGDPLTLDQRLLPLTGRQIEIGVQREGVEQPVILRVTPQLPVTYEDSSGPGSVVSLDTIGVAFPVTNVVRTVEPDSPAAAAGLRAGDKVTRVQFIAGDQPGRAQNAQWLGANYGEPIELSDDPPNWHYIHTIMQWVVPGTEIKLTYDREGVTQTVTVTPHDSDRWFLASRGLNWPALVQVRTAQSWSEAFVLGVRETKSFLAQLLIVSERLVTGRIAASNVGGPVTIRAAARSKASEGVPRTLIFLAFLSVNLGVLNLLPIPGLDGGHLLFLAIQGIRRRPISRKTQSTIIVISLVAFVCLFRTLSIGCLSQLLRLIQLMRRKGGPRSSKESKIDRREQSGVAGMVKMPSGKTTAGRVVRFTLVMMLGLCAVAGLTLVLDVVRMARINQRSPEDGTAKSLPVVSPESASSGPLWVELSDFTAYTEGPDTVFSVNYQIIGQSPEPESQYFWVVSRSKGDSWMRIASTIQLDGEQGSHEMRRTKVTVLDNYVQTYLGKERQSGMAMSHEDEFEKISNVLWLKPHEPRGGPRADQEAKYEVGDAVEVSLDGTWKPAKVVDISSTGRITVAFQQSGVRMTPTLPPHNVRPAAEPTPQTPAPKSTSDQATTEPAPESTAVKLREIVVGSGATEILDKASGNKAHPVLVRIRIPEDVSTAEARISGEGHNQDRDGYLRTMEVEINGRVLKVIPAIPQGQTKSFDMAVPEGVLVSGWNDIRAYIEWSNDDYDRGHWVSLTLALE